MNSRHLTKGLIGVLAIATLALLFAPLGCQTSGKLVSAETSNVCPTCKMETRTTAIKGVTYSKCICPSCKNETQLDQSAAAVAIRSYVGDQVGTTVQVCDHCKAIVGQCPVCRKLATK